MQTPQILPGGCASSPFNEVSAPSTGGVSGLSGGSEEHGGLGRSRPHIPGVGRSRVVASWLGQAPPMVAVHVGVSLSSGSTRATCGGESP